MIVNIKSWNVKCLKLYWFAQTGFLQLAEKARLVLEIFTLTKNTILYHEHINETFDFVARDKWHASTLKCLMIKGVKDPVNYRLDNDY